MVQVEQPPKSTVLVLTALIAVIGSLGTGALFSNIDPSVKAWLVGIAYFLVVVLALAAVGSMTSLVRRFRLARFNDKLRRNYGRLRLLRPYLGEVAKIDDAYRNL